MLFKVNGIDTVLGVEQIRLFEDGTQEVDVVTSVEAESGENLILEEKSQGGI